MGGSWTDIGVEVLRIVSAPAVMVLCMAVIFRASIREFLKNIVEVRVGEGGLTMRQQPTALANVADVVPPSPADATVPGKALAPLSNDSDKQSLARQRADSAMVSAEVWEYRYLNLFLVANTVKALGWLAELDQAITDTHFDNVLGTWGIRAEQRGNIFNALREHHLVSYSTRMIAITPKGRNYLSWRAGVATANLPGLAVPTPTPGGAV